MKRLVLLFFALMTIASAARAWITSIDGHEFVDLDLPSGTLWATCNVGADTPEARGKFFAWGETEFKDMIDGSFEWGTYKYYDETNEVITKYNESDGRTELLPSDDAATANWGSQWRMPTLEQYKELSNTEYVTLAFTTQNNIDGLKVTSRTNGNSIFLPAVGYGCGRMRNCESRGMYWSRTLWSRDKSKGLMGVEFGNVNGLDIDNGLVIDRCYGLCVRPVTTVPNEAYAVLTFSGAQGTLRFYCDNKRKNREGEVFELNSGDAIPAWRSKASQMKHVVFDSSFANARPTTTHNWFMGMQDVETITGLSYLNTDEVTDMGGMFNECRSLTSLDLSNFNTERVTSMQAMFSWCTRLKSLDLTNFNTANATAMSSMFVGCDSLMTLRLSSFNTSKVTSMENMFKDCKQLTNLNLTSFNTYNVEDMDGMFSGCTHLRSIRFSYSFYTTNVTSMQEMFNGCSSLTELDLSNFNTSKTTTMYAMFSGCSSLTTLDLSSFDTDSSLTISIRMFSGCSNLETIYIGPNWGMSKIKQSTNMFSGCTKIKGKKGTTYNASVVDATYAHLDEGSSNPGYLSTRSYGVTIGGVEVTEMNHNDIPITSGTASMPNNSLLYLTDAVIDGSPAISSNVNNLTVLIKGTCQINGFLNLMGENVSFIDSDEAENTKLKINSTTIFKGELEIRNKYVEINSGDNTMFQGDGTTSKLKFGPRVELIGSNDHKRILSKVTDLIFEEPTKMVVAGVAGIDDSNIYFSAPDQTIIVKDGSNVTALTDFLLIGQYYPLWFGSLHLSNTMISFYKSLFNQEFMTVSYDEDDVLVVKTAPLFSSLETNNTSFRSEVPNLRIELGYDWNVKSDDASTPAMYLGGNTTITGEGKVTVESAGQGIVLKDNLTVDGIDMVVTSAKQGIYGCTILVGPKQLDYLSTLTVKNSNLSITSSGEGSDGYCLYRLKDLSLVGCSISNFVTFSDHQISSNKVVIEQGLIYFAYNGIYYHHIGYGDVEVINDGGEYGSYSGEVVIPESAYNENDSHWYTVTEIGERAFYRCPSVKSVTIPQTIDVIRNEAFYDCFGEFPTASTITCLAMTPPSASPTAFDNFIFSDVPLYVLYGTKAAYQSAPVWKNFSTIIELPYSFVVNGFYYKITGEGTVSVSYKDSNYNCYSGDVVIPSTVTYDGVTYTVTKIDNLAFFNCTGLTSVSIPETVTAIGNRTFKNCSSLTSIVVPNSVTSIGLNAFEDCEALSAVTLGSGLKSIGDYAFYGCTELIRGNITCLATEPPTIFPNTFVDQYQGANLYVPYGCHDVYANADYWKDFYDIYELLLPIVTEEFAGTLWQEIDSNGQPYSSSETNKTVTLKSSAETPELVDIAFPGFTRADTNDKIVGFEIKDVNALDYLTNLTFYTLPEEMSMILSVGKTGRMPVRNVMVEGSKVLDDRLVLKLTMTTTINQTKFTLWFGPNDMTLDDIKTFMQRAEDIITGVDGVEIDTKDDVIYDLSGRKVEKTNRPGIYIKNGKKVLVK